MMPHNKKVALDNINELIAEGKDTFLLISNDRYEAYNLIEDLAQELKIGFLSADEWSVIFKDKKILLNSGVIRKISNVEGKFIFAFDWSGLDEEYMGKLTLVLDDLKQRLKEKDCHIIVTMTPHNESVYEELLGSSTNKKFNLVPFYGDEAVFKTLPKVFFKMG